MTDNLHSNGAEKSHIAHEVRLNNLINEKDRLFITLKNKNCLSYLLNIRTLDILNPLFKNPNTWLSIGDFNGFEAKYFLEHNQKAVASDISDSFLIEAKKDGYITDFCKENVEKLSFNDNHFDYVSCREAYHHFPRAFLGLYEMIRVAKKGAIIIEPVDILSKMPILLFIKNLCDRINPQLINKIWKNRFSWEPIGNYVFKLSEREIEKVAMGMGLPCIAFKEINILLEIKEDITETPVNLNIKKLIFRRISKLNFLSKLRIIPYNTICAIIFKEMPDLILLSDLKKEGYKIIELPKNPYLK